MEDKRITNLASLLNTHQQSVRDVLGTVVQTHNRELACLQACSAILHSNDRLLVLGSLQGSNIAKYLVAVTYRQHHLSSKVDYKAVQDMIDTYTPRSAFANDLRPLIGYETLGISCRAASVYLVADITENSGMIAAGVAPSPFERTDILISGTRGNIHGPSGTLIFFRKNAIIPSSFFKLQEEAPSLGSAIDMSVFPGHQGGPHNHAIMAVAVTLEQVPTQSFKAFQKLVLANAEALRNHLVHFGYRRRGSCLYSQHLIIELQAIDITILKEFLRTIAIATSIAIAENELHISTQAMTSRGLFPHGFFSIAEFLHQTIMIAKSIANFRVIEINIGAKAEDSPSPFLSNIKSSQSWNAN